MYFKMKIAYKYIILYCLISMSSGYLYWFPNPWKIKLNKIKINKYYFSKNNTNNTNSSNI